MKYKLATEHKLAIGEAGEVCTYKIDEGTIIKHNYNKGFVPLVKKMLNTIDEKKVTF